MQSLGLFSRSIIGLAVEEFSLELPSELLDLRPRIEMELPGK